jgi:hypothetical protein
VTTDTPPVDQADTAVLVPEVEGDEWPTKTRRSSLRLRMPTAVLIVLLLAGVGVWAGSLLQKHYGSSSSSAAASSSPFGGRGFAGRGAGNFANFGRGNFPGFGGAGASTGQGTSGTVTLVRGDVVWVTTSTGGLVKVTIGKSTTVTRTAVGNTKGLQLGDSVVVIGSKKNGAVAATIVRATQKGLSTSSGFGAPTGG